MTDPDLHPLPITPNDPLSIVSTSSKSSILTISDLQFSTKMDFAANGAPINDARSMGGVTQNTKYKADFLLPPPESTP